MIQYESIQSHQFYPEHRLEALYDLDDIRSLSPEVQLSRFGQAAQACPVKPAFLRAAVCALWLQSREKD